ncbi:hypothetical protein OIU78_017467 [Salix suchowensis]|nr:hypothetical protein OIU78_017467 [Salix suchowensis]
MLPPEADKYCEENKVQSALSKIIKTGFSSINLIYFFTAGPDEVKCWQIRRQTKAPQAAGAIHTDFERGFICAEVMKFNDLKGARGLGVVNDPCSNIFPLAAGKYKQEGKTYVVQDGDIIFFKFNVSGVERSKIITALSNGVRTEWDAVNSVISRGAMPLTI